MVGGAAGQLRRPLNAEFWQGLDAVVRAERVQQAPLHLTAAFRRVAAQGAEIESHRLHRSAPRGSRMTVNEIIAFNNDFCA